MIHLRAWYEGHQTVSKLCEVQGRWSAIPISLSFSQFVMIHTVKGLNIVNETEMLFWNFLAFSMIQQMLAI